MNTPCRTHRPWCVGYVLLPLVAVLLDVCAAVNTIDTCRSKYNIDAGFTHQFLTTPGYPNNFPRPSYCSWTFNVANNEGNRIVFQFHDFDLESSVFCYKDLLTLLDGSTGYEVDLVSDCGSWYPYEYTENNQIKTSGDSAHIDFRGVNPGFPVKGFNLSFWTEFKLELPSRPAKYGPANYFLFGITGVVIVGIIGGLVMVFKKHWNQVVEFFRDPDDDDLEVTLTASESDVTDQSASTSEGPGGSQEDKKSLKSVKSSNDVVKILISPPQLGDIKGLESIH